MNDDQYSNRDQSDNVASLPSTQASGNPIPASSDDPYQPQQQDTLNLQQQINAMPAEANDLDLIEKEWVTHLKYIVEQTQADPYLQQSEISKAKADYMRKRYNKDVKISEG